MAGYAFKSRRLISLPERTRPTTMNHSYPCGGVNRRSFLAASAASLPLVSALPAAGVKTKDMFVYDRYRSEFMDAGYPKILPGDIRWGGITADGGDQFQLDFPSFRSDPIAGYDHDAFVWMDLVPYGDDPKDDRKY